MCDFHEMLFALQFFIETFQHCLKSLEQRKTNDVSAKYLREMAAKILLCDFVTSQRFCLVKKYRQKKRLKCLLNLSTTSMRRARGHGRNKIYGQITNSDFRESPKILEDFLWNL